MWLCAGHHPRLAPCASHQTPAAWRGCIPMNLQEGDVAVYWPSPAARAMRLTARVIFIYPTKGCAECYFLSALSAFHRFSIRASSASMSVP
jgi:hypothetical protein